MVTESNALRRIGQLNLASKFNDHVRIFQSPRPSRHRKVRRRALLKAAIYQQVTATYLRRRSPQLGRDAAEAETNAPVTGATRSTAHRDNALAFFDTLAAREAPGDTSEYRNGGEAGIRTLGTLARPTVFETAPFDRSGTSPRTCPRPNTWCAGRRSTSGADHTQARPGGQAVSRYELPATRRRACCVPRGAAVSPAEAAGKARISRHSHAHPGPRAQVPEPSPRAQSLSPVLAPRPQAQSPCQAFEPSL